MKKAIIVLGLLLTGAAATYAILKPGIIHPLLKTYGPVYDLPFATEKPDSTIEYKIVADVGEKYEKRGEVYAPLEQLARMYNLHIYGGVQQKNLTIAVVLWGEQVGITMNNEAYRKRYGVDNPNIKIIEDMQAAGVKFYVCGQSMEKFKVSPESINPNVAIALSRFTEVSTLQMKGYAYFKF